MPLAAKCLIRMQDEERRVDLTLMTSDGAFWSEAVMAACLEWLMERKV